MKDIIKMNEKITNEIIVEEKELKEEVLKKRKKIFIVVSIILVIIIVLRLIFGPLIYRRLSPYKKNHYFDIKVNDTLVNSFVIEQKNTTVIPYLFSVYRVSTLAFNSRKADYIGKLDEDIILDIDAYKCYSNNEGYKTQIGCGVSNVYANKKIDDGIEYTYLLVRHNNEEEKRLKFTNNLHDFIKDLGTYRITIIGIQDNVIINITINIKIQ